ncbi:low temperature requirement protein A [Microbacterium terricola]|uniref:Membrane protein n=1 Tax=Microbacterium terricola TaxID=344163 RepID=A0ABM8DVA6_9MICO|nr:low temperature requirement protein A [Microbacterium terricola]UYK39676.1 low temperature requirement protein A [Microbacterium terricola]BDV29581.1 membrane protein [Microbacterium terricola]
MSIVGGGYRHGLRRLRPRPTDEGGRAATPLELLFDLTFVASFAVAGTELAHGIADGHAGAATVAFLFAMFAVVWAWISVSWFASAFDNDDWLFRVLTMVQMTGVIVLAIGLPPLFASIEAGALLDNGVMVAGYVIIRGALVVQWMRAARANREYLPLAVTYAVFVGVAQAGWVLIALLPVTAAAGLAAAVVLFGVEALGPIVAERNRAGRDGGSTPWHPHHLAERFALLTIIALGETVFGTLSSSAEISRIQGWTVDVIVVVGVGIAMSFALWWTYFLLPHASVLAARREKAIPWGYAHILLFAAIAAVGAGLHLVGYAYDPEYDVDDTTVAASIALPVVIFMVVRYGLQAWLLSGSPRDGVVQLAAAALPVLAIALAAAGVPLWACLIVVLASPLSVILSFELGGWRALDAQLARVIGDAGPEGDRIRG